jgi:PEGA domain
MILRISQFRRSGLILLCMVLFIAGPVHAFTANSLDITVDKNGDAVAIFRFTLEGLIENAIPQSVLQDQLQKGLTTSNDPPQLLSMDRSSATLLLKNFSYVSAAPTGTQYQTATMDFSKAEIALKSSAVSSVISADFSPKKITVTFPDNYTRELDNVDLLPAITHTTVDTAKPAAETGSVPTKGEINVLSSQSGVRMYMDGSYTGDIPANFTDISPGPHSLEFRKDGYLPVTKPINLTSGQTLQLSVFLAGLPPTATPSAPGFTGILAGIAMALCVMVRMRTQE